MIDGTDTRGRTVSNYLGKGILFSILFLATALFLIGFIAAASSDDASADTTFEDPEGRGYVFTITDTTSVEIKSYSGTETILSLPETVKYQGATYNITSIGESAFAGNLTLMSLSSTGKIENIGRFAFRDCESLTAVTLGSTVQNIREYAFDSCGTLGTVTLGGNLKTIGDYAFRSAGYLKTITIPLTVESIGQRAFEGCKGLSQIIVQEGNPNYSSTDDYDGILYNYTKSEIIICPEGKSGTVVIIGKVSKIGDRAFYGCANIETLDNSSGGNVSLGNYAFHGCKKLNAISDTSKFISYGAYSFYNCTSLKSFTLYNITSVPEYAFYGCSMMSELFFNSTSLESIGVSAFENCSSLITFSMNSSLEMVGNNAFKNCANLTSVYLSTDLVSLGEGSFSGCTSLATLKISDSVEIKSTTFEDCTAITRVIFYKGVDTPHPYDEHTYTYTPWYKSRSNDISVEFPNRATAIGDYLFCGCTGLTKIDISATSVSTIGSYAFYGCTGLHMKLELPATLKTIGNYAFFKCSGIYDGVQIPRTVESIGDGVFGGCTSITAFTTNSNEHYVAENGILYDIAKNKLVQCYGSFTGEFEFPNSVTIIGSGAFAGCVGLSGSLYMPATVRTIGDYAFAGCTGLTGKLRLPTSLTTIGDYAFQNCSKITGTLELHETIQSIGKYAFDNCNKLSGAVSIPSKVYVVSEGLFANCYGLTSIAFNNITQIGDYAFFGCIGLSGSMRIPNGVVEIGDYAFYDCLNINELYIPISLVPKASTFTEFTGLTTVHLTSGVNKGVGADYDSTTCTFTPWYKTTYYSGSDKRAITLDLDPDITSIGAFMFCGCGYNENGITGSIQFHEGLTTIGANAFSGCLNITEFVIPKSVTSIGDMAFVSCWNLKSITVAEGNQNYRTMNGVLLNTDMTELLVCPGGFEGAYSIPDTVTKLNNYVFQGCVKLESVIVPDSVRTIGDMCFDTCSGLESLTMPIDVKLGATPFRGCSSLKTVTLTCGDAGIFSDRSNVDDRYPWYISDTSPTVIISEGITYLGRHMFDNSNIGGLILPSTVTDLGPYILTDCYNLESLTMPVNLKTYSAWLTQGMYRGCTNLSSLTLIAGEASGRGTDYTKDIVKYMPWGVSTKQITLTIDEGVLSIGQYMFYECIGISNFTFPETMTHLGDYAFYGTTGTQTMHIPKNLEMIGESALSKCDHIELFTVDEENEWYTEDRGILYNKSLTELLQCPTAFVGSYSIISTTVRIWSYAFYGCTNLESVTIPENVLSINDYAFYQCSSLKMLSMPASLSIHNNTIFQNCESITTVVFLDCDSHRTASYTANTCKYTPWYKSSEAGMGITAIINEGVNSIDDYLFYGCTNLVDVSLPTTMVVVSSTAFKLCSNIESITVPVSLDLSSLFPSDVTRVKNVVLTQGSGSAVEYTKETSQALPWVKNKSTPITVTVSEGVQQISSYMFYKAIKVEEVTIPDTVTSIGSEAFSDCSGLISIDLPETLESIGESSFYNCTSLTEITLGEKITMIPDRAFEKCSSLMVVTLIGMVDDIGDRAFMGCTQLAKFHFYNEVMHVGAYAFSGCTNLSEISVPVDFRFEKTVFVDTESVTKVIFTYGNSGFGFDYSAESAMYTPWYKNRTPSSIAIEFEQPETEEESGIYHVGSYMFYGCVGVASISLPTTIDSIGNYAFYGTAITSFIMKEGVSSLGDYVFGNCTMLTTISIANTVVVFGAGLFYGCNVLSEMSIPVDISYRSEMYSGCNSLTKLTFTPGQTGRSINYYNNWHYLTAWFMTQNELTVVVSDGVTYIGDYMFHDCTMIKSMTFHSKVITFGSSVFGSYLHFYNKNGDRITSYSIGLPGNTFEGDYDKTTMIRALHYKEIIAVQTVNIKEDIKSVKETTSPSGRYFNLTLEILPENATDKSVTWTSSDNSVVTVDSKGRVKIVGVGTAIITVRSITYNKADTCEVVVSHPTVYYERVEADCGKGTIGHIEYWMCDCCGKKFEDKQGEKELTSWEIQPTHDFKEVDAVPPTCTSEGNVHYYHCMKCLNDYENPDGTGKIDDVTIKKISHEMEFIEGYPAVDEAKGKADSYHCLLCDKYYSDTEGTVCYKNTDTYNVRLIVNDSSLGALSIDYLNDVLVGSEIVADGNILMVGNYRVYALPKSETPAMTYELKSWNYEGDRITGYTVIEAEFIGTVRQYNIVFYVDEGKTEVMQSQRLDYGSPISKPIFNPTKASTEKYDYTFLTWMDQSGLPYDEKGTVSKDLEYIPKFQESYRYYSVRFISEGEIYWKTEQQYGSVIELPDPPKKEQTESQVFTFSHWSGYTEGMTVKGNTEFNAVFDPSTRYYTATFMSGDEIFKVIENLRYEAEIPDPGKPSKAASDVYQYEFTGWDNYNQGTIITKDVTYNAIYSLIMYDYTIKSDGTVTLVCNEKTSFSISRDVIIKMKQDVSNHKMTQFSIQFQNGTIVLDSDSISSLTNEKQKVSFDELEYDMVPAAMKKLVGERSVYSINIGSVHQFGGTLTISIRYSPGVEDTNNLVIWYITASGSYQEISCSYSNGFVTFQTNHLSYYSIIVTSPPPDSGMFPYIAAVLVICALVGIVALCVIRSGRRVY